MSKPIKFPFHLRDCPHGIPIYLVSATSSRQECACETCKALLEAYLVKHGGHAPLWFCDRHKSNVRTKLCPECVDEDARDQFLRELPERLQKIRDMPGGSACDADAALAEIIAEAERMKP